MRPQGAHLCRPRQRAFRHVEESRPQYLSVLARRPHTQRVDDGPRLPGAPGNTFSPHSPASTAEETSSVQTVAARSPVHRDASSVTPSGRRPLPCAPLSGVVTTTAHILARQRGRKGVVAACVSGLCGPRQRARGRRTRRWRPLPSRPAAPLLLLPPRLHRLHTRGRLDAHRGRRR